jgi:hypothetical protein
MCNRLAISLLPILTCLACGGLDGPAELADASANVPTDGNDDAVTPVASVTCDPFAAKALPITLGAVIAAGSTSAGVIYAVDQVGDNQRVFVSDGTGTLLRQRIAGSGVGPDFYVFTVTDSTSPFTLQIDTPASGPLRMGVVPGTLTTSKTFVIGQQGEELTVLAAGALADMPVQNLPGEVVIEYAAGLVNGTSDVMVVTRPRDDWTYADFRLFLGPMSAVAERKVSNVTRMLDGGSTTIAFDLDGSPARADFPVVFADGGFAPGPATLTVGSTTTALTRHGAQAPAGAVYLCFEQLRESSKRGLWRLADACGFRAVVCARARTGRAVGR